MRDRILSAALSIAQTRGLGQMTRSAVARRARCVPGSVSYHFNGMPGLQKAVIQEAVETNNLRVLASAVSVKHPAVEKLAEDIKRKALLSLAS